MTCAPESTRQLRAKMVEKGVIQADIMQRLKRGNNYVSERMNLKKSFTLDEAYSILEFLDVDPREIYTYFPGGSKS